MFTENYAKYRRLMFYNTTVQSYGYASERPTLIDGTTMHSFYPQYNYFGDIGNAIRTARVRAMSASYGGSTTAPSGNSSAYPGVYFGSGNKPANKADYCLESLITSGLSVVNSYSQNEDDGNGVYTLGRYFLLENTSEAEINIYEIGLFAGLVYYDSKFYFCPVLMERTVLPAPITIPPGETKLVSYKLIFNQTLSVE